MFAQIIEYECFMCPTRRHAYASRYVNFLLHSELYVFLLSRPEKSLPKKGNFYGKQMLSGDAARSRKNAA